MEKRGDGYLKTLDKNGTPINWQWSMPNNITLPWAPHHLSVTPALDHYANLIVRESYT